MAYEHVSAQRRNTVIMELHMMLEAIRSWETPGADASAVSPAVLSAVSASQTTAWDLAGQRTNSISTLSVLLHLTLSRHGTSMRRSWLYCSGDVS